MTRPPFSPRVVQRWLSFRLCALACALFAFGCGQKPRPGQAPRHLLLVTVENLRADHVTHLGHERRTTALLRPDQPVVLDIDSVAQSGVAFSEVCAPSADPEFSLASLLGGAYPVRNGELSVAAAFPADEMSLGEAFEAAGFVTACFVSSNSLASSNQGPAAFAKGFSHGSFHSNDKQTLAAAVPWLSEQFPKGARHFTWIHLAGIQAPFEGAPFLDRHSPELPAGEGFPAPSEFVSTLQSAGTRPSLVDMAHLNDLYDGQLVRTTELINSFFYLYKNDFGVEGLWDDTIVSVAGVTGCELAEADGGIADRGSLREEALRVPVLFSHRRSLTGERIFGEVVELPDLGATFRDWFRIDSGPAGARSLLAITDSYIDREFPMRPALSLGQTEHSFSLRNERYRIVQAAGSTQLFDLQSDPSGTLDVSADWPEVVSALLGSAHGRLQQLGLVQ